MGQSNFLPGKRKFLPPILWIAAIIFLSTVSYYLFSIFFVDSENAAVYADIYAHRVGFTQQDAEKLKVKLEANGISSTVRMHVNPNTPDSIFIGMLVPAHSARIALTSVPYEIEYIFRPDYPAGEGGDPSGYLIGIGYSSTHNSKETRPEYRPVKISNEHVKYLTESGLTNHQFQNRLREITLPRSPE